MNMFVGSYGSGGRRLSFKWSLLYPNVLVIRNLLESYPISTSRIIISHKLLVPGIQYHVSLNMTNYLGGTCSRIAVFMVTAKGVPTVVIPSKSHVWVNFSFCTVNLYRQATKLLK